MRYATRVDIENIFGEDNVSKWADLDNTEDEAKIEDRINYALEFATSEMNDYFSGTAVEVPFAAPPLAVRHRTAVLAGLWLYSARGHDDIDPETGNVVHKYADKRREIELWVQRVKAGIVRLPLFMETASYPAVVLDSDYDD